MKFFGFISVFLFALGASAQTLTLSTVGPVAPIGTYQTVTSEVVGVNDKTVTWTSSAGTIVGTNPCTAAPCTIALYDTTPGTYTLTATSNANHSVTATSTITFTASPAPVLTHPHLGGITAATLPALQAKAITGNKLYNNGIYQRAVTEYTAMNAIWSWSCNGGTGLPSSDQSESFREGDAYTFAYMSMVDPSDATYKWGCYARDIWTYDANFWLNPMNLGYSQISGDIAIRAVDANYGLTGNHGSDSTEDLTLAADWALAYGNLGAGSGATMSGALQTASITATTTISTNTLSSVTVVSGTPAIGLGVTGTGIAPGSILTSLSPYTLSHPATASGSATLTVGGVIPTISAGGSGYLATSTNYWYAYVGSSGCPSMGSYGSYISSGAGNNGTAIAAMGTVQTNSSGVVAGTITTLVNTPGCTSAPNLVILSDQTITRNYFAVAAAQMTNIHITGSVPPIGGYNSSSQFNGSPYDFVGMRAMGNNYSFSKLMYLTAASLTFNNNSTDDPMSTNPFTGATTNTCSATAGVVCPDGSAFNLHAYFTYLDGASLYKEYAHLEDPNVSWQAYQAAYGNLPTQPKCNDTTSLTTTTPIVPCFGDGVNGQSSEGSWYQYSMYRLELAMLSIYSAGYLDPIAYGPQMSLFSSSWWDLKTITDDSQLTYSEVPGNLRYTFFATGDTIHYFRFDYDFNYSAWELVGDALTGRTDRTSQLSWPLFYGPGGPASFYVNLQNDNGSPNAIPMFTALAAGDPASSPPPDPRSNFPTTLYSGLNNQEILARSGWINNGPISPSSGGAASQQVFHSICQNSRIDHEHETCGAFEILSNGEYITKQREVPGNYNMMFAAAENSNLAGWAANQNQTVVTFINNPTWATSVQGMNYWSAQAYPVGAYVINGATYYVSNTATVSTDVPGTAADWTAVTAKSPKGGGQLWHQQQGGNAFLNHAELPGYIAFDVNTTPLYSGSALAIIGWSTISGVSAASRSLIYLRGSNRVLVYDRGTGAQYSRDWLTTTGPITITGNTTSWPTRSGTQQAYLTNLLPSGVAISDQNGYLTAANGTPSTEDWEPYSHVLEDAGSPSSTQFLNVLEWGASSFTKSTTTLVQSTAGQGFDCALVGASMGCFMRSWPATFTGTTYAASGATTQYVSDLTANTTYAITGAGTPSTATTDNAGVLTFSAGGTGNIQVGAPSVLPPTQLSGEVSIAGSAQIQ